MKGHFAEAISSASGAAAGQQENILPPVTLLWRAIGSEHLCFGRAAPRSFFV